MVWNSAIDYIRISYEIIPTIGDERHLQTRLHAMLGGNKAPVLPVIAGGLRGYRLDGMGYTILRDINRDRYVEIAAGSICQKWEPPVYATQVRVSRLDVAIDVLLDEYDSVQPAIARVDNHLDELYEEYAQLQASKAKNWYKRRITRITNANGGTTVYLGSRFSDVFLRLYNKTAELAHIDKWIIHQAIVRYELELKGAGIERWAVTDHIMSGSASELVHRLTVWMVDHYRLPIRIDDRVNSTWYRVPKRDNELDRKLRWVRESVIPSIRLLAHNGYADELRLLGIEWIGGVDIDTEGGNYGYLSDDD